MNNNWYLYIQLENGIPMKLITMIDSSSTICGTISFIGPIGHLKKNSNLDTWTRLIEVLNKGFGTNDKNDQQVFIDSIKYLIEYI